MFNAFSFILFGQTRVVRAKCFQLVRRDDVPRAGRPHVAHHELASRPAAAEMAAAGAMSKDLAAKLAQFEAMNEDD